MSSLVSTSEGIPTQDEHDTEMVGEWVPTRPPVSMVLYAEVGVPWAATTKDIMKAYRKKASKVHPDRLGGDSSKFVSLSEAYRILCVSSKRKLYHEEGISDSAAEVPQVDLAGVAVLAHALQEAIITMNPLSGRVAFKKYKDADLMEAIRKILHGKLEQKRVELTHCQDLLEGFNSLAKRTKHKPKKGKIKKAAVPDFIGNMLKQQVSGQEHKILQIQEDMEDINAASAILEDYGFDFTPPQPATGSFYTHTSTYTG